MVISNYTMVSVWVSYKWLLWFNFSKFSWMRNIIWPKYESSLACYLPGSIYGLTLKMIIINHCLNLGQLSLELNNLLLEALLVLNRGSLCPLENLQTLLYRCSVFIYRLGFLEIYTFHVFSSSLIKAIFPHFLIRPRYKCFLSVFNFYTLYIWHLVPSIFIICIF